MTASLRFLGAAGTVTGSKFLVETDGARLLVDCGLYQGERELRRRNWADLPVPPDSIDAVVLSHAHLDHCGWLPRLVAGGFHGPVYCSPWTAKIAPIVLRDAAHLQEEDAAFAARHGYSRHRTPLPLFDTADADKAVALLRPLPFGVTRTLADDLEIVLHRAGHILGSATVHVSVADRSVVFSGDLGRRDHPLLNPPEPPPGANAIVVESTYGDQSHQPHQPQQLAAAISRAFHRGGTVLIPAFAIDRTPVLLMALRDLMRTGAVPQVPVYVDSPMALAALDVYREAVAEGGPEIRPQVRTDPHDPFDPGELQLVHTPQESQRLDQLSGPCIIVSASGMATGGRVVHHLQHMLPQPRNLILLPGFQVAGTRGRALLDGARAIKMYGGYVPVRAEVKSASEFSAHADADGIINWLRAAPWRPDTCYVVHGEPSAAATLADRVDGELGWCAAVARHDERVLL
ncbi:MBL fold metallo-hydrolase [Catellatospora sp. NPDC049111]|uniref:MBL fold metallo-hydrolase n=1 Tax=Catellatospora sp. NPDC049111 TaxID=3155271 RepID=UPI0033EF1D52